MRLLIVLIICSVLNDPVSEARTTDPSKEPTMEMRNSQDPALDTSERREPDSEMQDIYGHASKIWDSRDLTSKMQDFYDTASKILDSQNLTSKKQEFRNPILKIWDSQDLTSKKQDFYDTAKDIDFSQDLASKIQDNQDLSSKIKDLDPTLNIMDSQDTTRSTKESQNTFPNTRNGQDSDLMNKLFPRFQVRQYESSASATAEEGKGEERERVKRCDTADATVEIGADDSRNVTTAGGGSEEVKADAYDCDSRNPCTPDNLEAGHYYYANDSVDKFVQCTELGLCVVMDCPAGTVWISAADTCGPEFM